MYSSTRNMLAYDRFLLFVVLLLCSYANACKNFLTQHCTDIPIGFRSISPIKCVQLVPTQLDSSIDYTVDNFVIEKVGSCFNVLRYDSTRTTVFSSECRELCPEQYCLLFDKHSNTSIINIFYSSTFSYVPTADPTSPSQDYALFDGCSSDSSNSKMLIIVYVLCGIVSVLTVGVLLKYLLSCIFKRTEPGYDPWSWRWLVDTLLCRRRPDNEPPKANEGNHRVDTVFTADDGKQNDNQLHLTSNHRSTPSQTQLTWGAGSSPRIQRQNKNSSSNSASTSDPRSRGLPSERSTPTMPRRVDYDYVDLRPLPQPLLQKLSSRASIALEALTGPRHRPLLESQSSISVIEIRL